VDPRPRDEQLNARFRAVLHARGDPRGRLTYPQVCKPTHIIKPIKGRRMNRRGRAILEDMELKVQLPIVLADSQAPEEENTQSEAK